MNFPKFFRASTQILVFRKNFIDQRLSENSQTLNFSYQEGTPTMYALNWTLKSNLMWNTVTPLKLKNASPQRWTDSSGTKFQHCSRNWKRRMSFDNGFTAGSFYTNINTLIYVIPFAGCYAKTLASIQETQEMLLYLCLWHGDVLKWNRFMFASSTERKYSDL